MSDTAVKIDRTYYAIVILSQLDYHNHQPLLPLAALKIGKAVRHLHKVTSSFAGKGARLSWLRALVTESVDKKDDDGLP